MSSSPKPTPTFSNHRASSSKLGTYPQGPGSCGSSSVPRLGFWIMSKSVRWWARESSPGRSWAYQTLPWGTRAGAQLCLHFGCESWGNTLRRGRRHCWDCPPASDVAHQWGVGRGCDGPVRWTKAFVWGPSKPCEVSKLTNAGLAASRLYNFIYEFGVLPTVDHSFEARQVPSCATAGWKRRRATWHSVGWLRVTWPLRPQRSAEVDHRLTASRLSRR